MVYWILAIIAVTVGVVVFFWQSSLLFSAIFGAPTVYANNKAIIDAYKLARLGKGETVLDLGCGNAKSLIIAAQKFGAYGIGVEISPYCYLKSRWNVLIAGQRKNIKIYLADLKKSQSLIAEADVIYLYLLNSVLEKIEDQVFGNIQQKARVATLAFKFAKRQPSRVIRTKNLRQDTNIYLYQK